jgi:hypothetical protein
MDVFSMEQGIWLGFVKTSKHHSVCYCWIETAALTEQDNMRLGNPSASLDTLEKQFLQILLNIFQRVMVQPSSQSGTTVQISVVVFERLA